MTLVSSLSARKSLQKLFSQDEYKKRVRAISSVVNKYKVKNSFADKQYERAQYKKRGKILAD